MQGQPYVLSSEPRAPLTKWTNKAYLFNRRSTLPYGAALFFTQQSKRPRVSQPPNILLISLDTLRADHVGCYGYHRYTSRNIDKFAEGAFLFGNCIASSSWTLPAHASVFTALHPSVHGADFWEHGGFDHSVTFYEEGLRVPLIVRLAGKKENVAANNESSLVQYRVILDPFLKNVSAGRAPLSASERSSAPLTEEERRQLKALGYM